MSGIKRATEPDPSSSSSSSSSSKSRCIHGTGGGGGGGGGGADDAGPDNAGGGTDAGGGGLYGMTAVGKVFHFLEGPAHVLRASAACRRWRELACAGSVTVWRVKLEREGILDKAKAFEIEVPPLVREGTLLEDEELASMAFYARVFALKVVWHKCCAVCTPRHACISPPPHVPATTTAAAQGYQMRDEDIGEYEDNPDREGGIDTAVDAWRDDPAASKARYGSIASWDVSEVTDLSKLFYNQAAFNGDLSCWEVGQVKYMDGMFAGATSFNGDLSRWNVGRVTYMEYMFHSATSFNGDLSRWDVGQVKSMHTMFAGATSFNGDLSRWDVGQVESMSCMFMGATSFTHQLDGAWSTSRAHRTSMFGGGCPGSIA